MCFGVRHRKTFNPSTPTTAVTVPRVPGPQNPPTRRVQQAPPQPPSQQQQMAPQRSYLEAARVPPGGQHSLQQQQQHHQQRVSQAPPRQQGQPPPHQPLQPGAGQASVRVEPVLPVGPLPHAAPPAMQPINVAGQPVLAANTFSADEEAAMEQDDAWANETIQELDDEVRDPIRVYSRIGKIGRAIHKREKRLDKARKEVDLQKAVLEEAQSELAARAQTVDSIVADLQRLREVQQDLSARHAQLVAEAAQQQRVPAQPSLEDEAQKAQQLLWNTAASLRQLGDDPRLSQAIALLGTLFQEASAVATVEQGIQQTPMQPNTEQGLLPGQVTAPACAPATPPVAAPPQPVICCKCWSVACRCSVANVAAAMPPVVDIEVDQERGQKRSCVEAALPERVARGPQGASALLVDADGKPARPEAADDNQSCSAASTPASNVEGKAKEDCQPLESDTLQQGQASGTTCEMAVGSSGQPAQQPGPVQATADADVSVEEAGKEQSRKTFAALVRETCSSRSYPY